VEFTDSITPLKNKFLLFYLIFCFGQLLWVGKVWGQCTVTINDNTDYTLPAGNNNARICINFNGNRSGFIALGNNAGVTVIISSTTTFTGAINQTSPAAYSIELNGSIRGNRTLENGSLLIISSGGQYDNSGTLTVNNGSVNIRTGGSISRPVIVNNASSYSNSGTSAGAVTLRNASTFNNENGATFSSSLTMEGTSNYINRGTHSGSLLMNGTNTVVTNEGTMTFINLNGSKSVFNNTSPGVLTVNQNGYAFNFNFNNTGRAIFTGVGDLAINNPIINSGILIHKNYTNINLNGGSLENTGSIQMTGNLNINRTLNSLTGSLTIGGNLTNNRSSELGNTNVSGNFVSNDLVQLAGALTVGGNMTVNNSKILSANYNQCNSISVTGIFTNFGTVSGNNLGIPGGRPPLIVNKAHNTGNAVIGGTVVDPSLSCDCRTSYSAKGTFYVPAGVTQITIEMIGGGGRGGNQTSNGRAGGGGGGAYSRITIPVTPGEPLGVFVGEGGNSTTANGGTTYVTRDPALSPTTASILFAGGGIAGANNVITGGNAGVADARSGRISFAGGRGSDSNGSGSGGGGSAAASNQIGNVGNVTNGGADPIGIGGPGGNGYAFNSAGAAPIGPFGGGGGGSNSNGSNQLGGNGSVGQVIIYYSCANPDPCSRIISSGTTGDYTIIEYFCDGTWSPPEGLSEYEVLIVGGGGAGGRTFTEDKTKSGGGGGGGAVVSLSFSITNGITGSPVYNIDIGEGGNGSATDTTASQRDGRLSSFNNGTRYIAGGGAGGGSSGGSSLLLVNGRSGSQNSSGGGGGARFNKDLGSGGISDGMGFNGGGGNTSSGNNDNKSGGGGGGAAGNGADATINGSNGGSGGSGKLTAINGTSLRYGAGGGGGSGATPGSGGIGGGGSGGNKDTTAQNGITNTGSGGGGAGGSLDDRAGGNGGSGVVIIRYQNFRILPVEFLYFNASFNSPIRTGELSWATAKEWENSHFEIERSINNIKSWTVIDQVAGAGYSDSPVAYSFQDGNLPAAGGIVYYRLKQVDFSGTYAYSDTKSIKVAAIKGKGAWIAYPNPSSEKNTVTVDLLNRSVYYDEPILIQISDIRGVSEVFTVNQIESISEVVNAYLDRSVSGVYILQLIWGNRSQQIKLLRE